MVAWVPVGYRWEADMGPFLGEWATICGPREDTVPVDWEVDFCVGVGTSTSEIFSSGQAYTDAYRYRYLGDDGIGLDDAGIYFSYPERYDYRTWNPPGCHLVVEVYPPYGVTTPPAFTPESMVPSTYSALGAAPPVVEPRGYRYEERIKLCRDTGQHAFTTVDSHRLQMAGANGWGSYGFGNDIFFTWTAPATKAIDEVAYFTLGVADGASEDSRSEVDWVVLEGGSYEELTYTGDPYNSLASPYLGFYLDYVPRKTYTLMISGYNLVGVAWGRALLQEYSAYTDDLATFDWTISNTFTAHAIWARYSYSQNFADHAAGYHPWLHQEVIDCCWSHTVVGNSGGYNGSVNTCPAIGGVSLSNTFSGSGGFAIGKNLQWAEDDFFGDDLDTVMWMASTTYDPNSLFGGTSMRNYRNSTGQVLYGSDPVTGCDAVLFQANPKWASFQLTPKTDDAGAGDRVQLGGMDAVVRRVTTPVEDRPAASRWVPSEGVELGRLTFSSGSESGTSTTITAADLVDVGGGVMKLPLLVAPSNLATPTPASTLTSDYEYSGGNVRVGGMFDPTWKGFYGPHRWYTVIDRRPVLFDPDLPDTICGIPPLRQWQRDDTSARIGQVTSLQRSNRQGVANTYL